MLGDDNCRVLDSLAGVGSNSCRRISQRYCFPPLSLVFEWIAMIHVLATIALTPGQRDAFLKEFRQLMPKVRAEQGCIEYGPAIDVQTGIEIQLPVRDDVVVVIEKWESLAALEAHLAAQHMTDFRTKVRAYVASVELQILQPA